MPDKVSRRSFIFAGLKGAAAAGFIAAGGRIAFAGDDWLDLVIRNGLIVDGGGGEPFYGDLGVRGERIAAIGNPGELKADWVIDAEGKAVSPGFIDIHSHTDTELLINPKAESKIRQGVTTELSGNCGGSVFPIKPDSQEVKEYAQRLGININWKDLASYQTVLMSGGIAVNHGTLVGCGTIRSYVLGEDARHPNADEMESMKRLIAIAMEQGAFGLSSGLEYTPDGFFTTEEMIELCSVVAKYGGFYATHMRSEDFALLEAVGEAITIAERAGLPLQISHLKASGKHNYYKVPMVFDLIERAYDRRLDVTADRYPYTAYSTGLSIFFPQWALDGGSEAFVARLKDSEMRLKMKAETLEKVEANNGWESILINSVDEEANRAYVGMRLDAAAAKAGVDPYEFACDLLISEGGNIGFIGFGMSEENTERILTHPFVMVCSDGYAIAPYGPLSEGTPHPRNYGTFPRFLQWFVREKGLLTLAQAVRKMTSMAADRMRLRDRGIIRTGCFADLVVFDPATVADRATYVEPKQYPAGIEYVIVNGVPVIMKGEHTGELPGKALRRGE
jgi:N-acyl-D-amino-acid deacylase